MSAVNTLQILRSRARVQLGSGRHEAVSSSFSNIHNGDLVTADGDQEGLGILLRADARAHQVCGI